MTRDLPAFVMTALQSTLTALICLAAGSACDQVTGGPGLPGGVVLALSLALGFLVPGLVFALLPPARSTSGQALIALGSSLSLIAAGSGTIMVFVGLIGLLDSGQTQALQHQAERTVGQLATDLTRGKLVRPEPRQLAVETSDGYVLFTLYEGEIYRLETPELLPPDAVREAPGASRMVFGTAQCSFLSTPRGLVLELRAEDERGQPIRIIKLLPASASSPGAEE